MSTAGLPTHLEKFLARLPPGLAARLRESPELFQAQQTEVLLRGVSRGMNYLSTVPALFRKRGWPQHEDAIAFVTAALCFYRWGQTADPRAFDNRFRVPKGTGFDERWRKLRAILRPRARDVIRILELEELVPTRGVSFSPIDEPDPDPEIALERAQIAEE